MSKADVLKKLDPDWVGEAIDQFLPDDLLVAYISSWTEGEGSHGAIVIALTPRALVAFKVVTTKVQEGMQVKYRDDLTLETLPLSRVEGWTCTWEGRSPNNSGVVTLVDGRIEVRLPQDVLGLGQPLALPLKPHDYGTAKDRGKILLDFALTLESILPDAARVNEGGR
jgi:hypothetical protein